MKMKVNRPTDPPRLQFSLDKVKAKDIDAVNQGSWILSIECRLEAFVIVAKCNYYTKILDFSFTDAKVQGCLQRQ